MCKKRWNIKTVTVIGANGTMGKNIAAIFASFGNAKIYLVSRTLEKSVIAKDEAYKSVRAESAKNKMIPCDYSQLEACVRESDLIFEVCAEDWKIKEGIHKRIAKFVEQEGEGKIFCSGTSGLPVTQLAKLYPDKYRHQFMGLHMFNPPYHMTLCELIPTVYTERDRSIFDFVKSYAEGVLYRTVVEVADTPAFLGNRIGFQFINEALQIADKFRHSGGIDYIDSIIGSFTGRTMPPLVTADFVGLDVHKAIVENIYENTKDYAHENFNLPEFVKLLISKGKIGRKTNGGLYKTIFCDDGSKILQVYDIVHGHYRKRINYTFPFVEEMVDSLEVGDYETAFHTLVENESVEAKLCCELLLKYIVYALNTAKELGCETGAADDVMATGFHWCPPLAMYQAFATVTDISSLCEARLDCQVMDVIKQRHLFDNLKMSRYDYRKFILAKH